MTATAPRTTPPATGLRSRATAGLAIALLAAATFGMSGAVMKPLLEAGWSPAAAVTARSLIGGVVLLPVALVLLRGQWSALWRGRYRVLLMALVGVAGTQLVYYAALQRIPVSTAILIEYLAPLLIVGWVWATSKRMPKPVVFTGSVAAVAGLALVIGPAGGALDPLGLLFAALSTVGCAIYYVVAAKPSDGLPPVALAASGLVLGGLVLGAVGLTGVIPLQAPPVDVVMLGARVPWFVPLLVVGILATGFAYAASITASEMLGSRLASFVGLLEVVAAAIYAWVLLGEALGPLQLVGGLLILAGIAFVRSEKQPDPPRVELEPGSTDTGAIATIATLPR